MQVVAHKPNLSGRTQKRGRKFGTISDIEKLRGAKRKGRALTARPSLRYRSTVLTRRVGTCAHFLSLDPAFVSCRSQTKYRTYSTQVVRPHLLPLGAKRALSARLVSELTEEELRP